MSTALDPQQPAGSAGEVFRTFLRLGLTSFGGPVAHLGYFRHELVTRRRWLTDQDYADLMALCQFLPGPASSQLGFALGLHRAGWAGALMAFAGFTLPSALILLALSLGAGHLDGPLAAGMFQGLKLIAVAVVAQAVCGMARSLCPDGARATIAVLAVALLAVLPGAAGMIAAILAGAGAGLLLPGPADGPARTSALRLPVSRRQGLLALALFALLLAGLPLIAGHSPALALTDAVYRAGALVFGGGHVVLPLLETGLVTPGLVTEDEFLAGYALAQAVPGPLFTFAAYLGAAPGIGLPPVAGAALALLAIFLPGFLLLIGVLPLWSAVQTSPAAQRAMRGANAAVVGILGAALYAPLFTGTIGSQGHLALALAAFVALTLWRLPPGLVVLLGAAAGALGALTA